MWRDKIVMLKKCLLCTLSRSRLVQTRHYYLLYNFEVKQIKAVFSRYSICELFRNTSFLQNTSGDCFWTNPGDLCGSSGKGIIWSFSISLTSLSKIMSHLLTKSSFDISCYSNWSTQPFHLYCGLWISHVTTTHSLSINTQNNWFKKKATFARSEKVESFQRNRHFRKVSVNKTFTHVQEEKKAISPRHSTYILPSVKYL